MIRLYPAPDSGARGHERLSVLAEAAAPRLGADRSRERRGRSRFSLVIGIGRARHPTIQSGCRSLPMAFLTTG
jgi:hypothetical protein